MFKPKEWDGMPDRFDNTWGIVKESGESLVSLFVAPSAQIVYLTFCSFGFSAEVCPEITNEQENFFKRFWAIPLEERKWKDLVTLNTLYAYCGGLEPTPEAQWLHASSCHRKSLCPSTSAFTPSTHITHLIAFSEMDIGRQRALVRKVATARKQQEHALGLAPNVGPKATLKRKLNTKDDRPSKKETGH